MFWMVALCYSSEMFIGFILCIGSTNKQLGDAVTLADHCINDVHTSDRS